MTSRTAQHVANSYDLRTNHLIEELLKHWNVAFTSELARAEPSPSGVVMVAMLPVDTPAARQLAMVVALLAIIFVFLLLVFGRG